jgi:hypothetical protein
VSYAERMQVGEDCLQGLEDAKGKGRAVGRWNGASIEKRRGERRTGAKRQQAMAQDASFTSCSGASTWAAAKSKPNSCLRPR